jgi:zinc carboxypeptidase
VRRRDRFRSARDLVLAAIVALAAAPIPVVRAAPAAEPAAAPGVRAGSPGAQDWTTPAERSGYRTTPRFGETMAYLRRIARAAPRQVRLETFGRTGEGRDLVAVVVAREGRFDPVALRRDGRPVILIQNSIHAGEMDGKDACLALLRDLVITRERADLLRRAVLVIIPIYNADGHERFGPHARINQNGPEEGGWRTQSLNLNLNRDYLKADALETRAFLRLWNRWLPDLFVDTHVTDGADFAYDVTYALDPGPGLVRPLSEWQARALIPFIEAEVGKAGHVIGPYVTLKDDRDPAKGMTLGPTPPRFSTGFATLRNRVGLLVETHMLKDYRTRVTGTYELLRAVIEVVDREAGELVAMDRAADAETVAAGRRYDPDAKFPLQMESDGQTVPYLFHGYRSSLVPGPISGSQVIEYSGEPLDMTIPRETGLRIARAVAPPLAYIVPAPWTGVIDVLQAHGLKILRTSADWSAEVETYRCEGERWLDHPFEGRQVLFPPGEGAPGVTKPSLSCRPARERLEFPRGSAVIPLDQTAAKVAIHFLEPDGPDSAVRWGFFNAIFEQKEYAEPYVMERVAAQMLRADPRLKLEFEQKLAGDADFGRSTAERLDFFYRRSPWWDARIGLYPVGRLPSLDGVPLQRARR